MESWRDVTLLPAAKALRDLANDPRLLSASQGQGAIGRLSDGAGSWEEAAAGAFGGDKGQLDPPPLPLVAAPLLPLMCADAVDEREVGL